MAPTNVFRKAPLGGRPGSDVAPKFPSDPTDAAAWAARWLTKSRFDLKQAYLAELDRRPLERNEARLKERFLAACERGRKIQLVQGVLTILLAFTAVTAAVGGLASHPALAPFLAVSVFQTAVTGFVELVQTIGAIAGALAIVLLVARLITGRYLEMVEVVCDYTAMQLATLKCM